MPAELYAVEELVDRLGMQGEGSVSFPRVLLVTGHPDDETIGAGGVLRRLGPSASVVCLTDGAPRDLRDARDAGFATRDEYAWARRLEFESVRKLAGIDPSNCHWLGFVDKEASFHLVGIVRTLAAILDRTRPDLILTHPYEGGHPDHDAAAFATSYAVRLLGRAEVAIPIAEFTSYNAGPMGETWCTDFLSNPGTCPRRAILSDEGRAFKRRLMECYSSQRWILHAFPCEHESFRVAPPYEFGSAPHHGRLFYERFDWGIAGLDWRELAKEAEEGLGRP